MIHSGQKLNRTRESKLKDQAVPDDFTKDVINNIENCEEPEWTIFSETVKEKGSEHCGVTTGGTSLQKRETWWWNTTVQEAIARKKEDVQEVETIESTRRSCCLQGKERGKESGKERGKENHSS